MGPSQWSPTRGVLLLRRFEGVTGGSDFFMARAGGGRVSTVAPKRGEGC